MQTVTGSGRGNVTRILRLLAWGGAAALLSLPLVAMQVSDEVHWTAFDFGLFAAMLGAAIGGFEFLLRRGYGTAYGIASAVAIGTAFLLVWIQLAVGIIGSEDDPANALFLGVLATGVAVAAAGRFRAAAMTGAMIATALAQFVAGIIAVAGFGGAGPVIGLTAVFTVSWLAAAWLYRRAA